MVLYCYRHYCRLCVESRESSPTKSWHYEDVWLTILTGLIARDVAIISFLKATDEHLFGAVYVEALHVALSAESRTGANSKSELPDALYDLTGD
jgi:hypothetical protein